MIRYLAIFGLVAGPVLAQPEEIAKYGPLLEQCYTEAQGAEAKAQCKGAMSQACIVGEDGGETTLGMTSCAHAEMEVWDKFLNQEYQTTMAVYRKLDSDEALYFPAYAMRVDNLRKTQVAWIAFRDAECALEYARWGSGSMRHIAGAVCLMEMTADRTIELLQMREEF